MSVGNGGGGKWGNVSQSQQGSAASGEKQRLQRQQQQQQQQNFNLDLLQAAQMRQLLSAQVTTIKGCRVITQSMYIDETTFCVVIVCGII